MRKLPVHVAPASALTLRDRLAGARATAATITDQARSAPEDDSSAPSAAAEEFALDATTCIAVQRAVAVPSTRACPLVTPLAPERYKVQFTIG